MKAGLHGHCDHRIAKSNKTAGLLLNKVSGVNMASLGNENNQIAIRQPIGPNKRFLFLEDGLPIRTLVYSIIMDYWK